MLGKEGKDEEINTQGCIGAFIISVVVSVSFVRFLESAPDFIEAFYAAHPIAYAMIWSVLFIAGTIMIGTAPRSQSRER